MNQDQCLKMPDNLINAGKFLGVGAATASLQEYFREPGVPPSTDEDHIYGHTFGLSKLREFLYKIDIYNASKVDDNERIYGFRVYYGKCKRDDPDFPMDPIDDLYRDVFFMPVVKSGEDLYKLHPLIDPELILGSSRPCPNQCSTYLHFI